jgi:LEA14-like dessication related protein
MKHNRQKIKRKWWLISLLLGTLLLSGCAAVQRAIDILQPKLSIKDVHVTDLSFKEVDLAVDVEVDNPNLLPIDLTGFDYDLKINNISFIKGQQDKQMKIASLEQSVFQIPVTLNYKNLYETFKSLKDQDSTGYQIACGVLFDLPGLGPTRIPFDTKGEFPTIKLPNIKVDGLKIKRLDFSGADMELKLQMDNPNAFDLLLNSIDYNLVVNGKTWVKGLKADRTQVMKKSASSIGIPITLDFAQVGLSLYQTLTGNKKLDYQFKGNLDLGSSLPLLKQATLPIDRSGNLNILH